MDVPHFVDTRLFEWLFSDEVLDLVEDVIGPDIDLFSSHLIAKPAGGSMRVPVARGLRLLARLDRADGSGHGLAGAGRLGRGERVHVRRPPLARQGVLGVLQRGPGQEPLHDGDPQGTVRREEGVPPGPGGRRGQPPSRKAHPRQSRQHEQATPHGLHHAVHRLHDPAEPGQPREADGLPCARERITGSTGMRTPRRPTPSSW